MANLSTERFSGLLSRLDSDRAKAAEKYLLLRHKLVRVFERLPSGDPEDLADQAIDRIAKRLEGEPIYNLKSFAYAVAMKICLETQRTSARFVSIDGEVGPNELLIGERDPEKRIIDSMRSERNMFCLRRCLRRLRAADYQLLVEYYKGEKQARIMHRQKLAEKRSTTMPRLRSEVNMLREKLRGCVDRCLKSDAKGSRTL